MTGDYAVSEPTNVLGESHQGGKVSFLHTFSGPVRCINASRIVNQKLDHGGIIQILIADGLKPPRSSPTRRA
jgi:hypothetical protein